MTLWAHCPVPSSTSAKHYKAVKSDTPDALVFQSLKDGKPMNHQNVLKRYIQPAAKKLGLQGFDWRCLRRSHATWLVTGGRRPEVRSGPDAAFAHRDHDAHLRSDRSCGTANGPGEAVPARWPAYPNCGGACPISVPKNSAFRRGKMWYSVEQVSSNE
jgi:hypothetical protein